MRLQLATGTAAAVPVSVGNSTDTPAGNSSGALAWGDYAPATGTGFLNTAVVVLGTATTLDFAFFTVSPAHVVNAISATITPSLAAGSNTITLPAPLVVNSGDYIGFWLSGGVVNVSRAAATGFTAWRITTTSTKPNPGDTLTPGVTLADFHWLLSGTT